jgi:hypothetical protein
MRQGKLNSVRQQLGLGLWTTLGNSEEFGRNRRNLYALSAAFVLFVVGGGSIDHADLFGGSVRFDNTRAIYVAAFVLLAYAWWRFEMTRPVHFRDAWLEEYRLVWPRTESLQKVLNPSKDRLIDERCNIEVHGRFPRVTLVALSSFVGSDMTNQGAPYKYQLPWWQYLYLWLCTVLVVVRIGRSVSEILLPRLLFAAALGFGLWRVAVDWWPSPVELVEFTD